MIRVVCGVLMAHVCCAVRMESSSTPPQPNKPDHVVKIVLIGSDRSGKDNIVNKYIRDEFENPCWRHYVDFEIKRIAVDGLDVKLHIFNIQGMDKLRSLTSAFYRGAQGIIFFYDATSERTFDMVEDWAREVRRYSADCVHKVLVSNKTRVIQYWQYRARCQLGIAVGMNYRTLTDIFPNKKNRAFQKGLLRLHKAILKNIFSFLSYTPGNRAVSVEKGQALADSINMPFFEVNAKTGENINELFMHSIRTELKMRAEAAPGNQQPVRLGTAASKNTWDCTIS